MNMFHLELGTSSLHFLKRPPRPLRVGSAIDLPGLKSSASSCQGIRVWNPLEKRGVVSIKMSLVGLKPLKQYARYSCLLYFMSYRVVLGAVHASDCRPNFGYVDKASRCALLYYR